MTTRGRAAIVKRGKILRHWRILRRTVLVTLYGDREMTEVIFSARIPFRREKAGGWRADLPEPIQARMIKVGPYTA